MKNMAELKFPCPVCGNEMKFKVPASDVRSVHITNADRIHAMTDEELAAYLANICYDLWKMFTKDPEKMWLDWLKQEARHE